jgi:hypothetical protein
MPKILTGLVSPPAIASTRAKKKYLPHHLDLAMPFAMLIRGGPVGRGGRDFNIRCEFLIDLSY